MPTAMVRMATAENAGLFASARTAVLKSVICLGTRAGGLPGWSNRRATLSRRKGARSVRKVPVRGTRACRNRDGNAAGSIEVLHQDDFVSRFVHEHFVGQLASDDEPRAHQRLKGSVAWRSGVGRRRRVVREVLRA